MTLFYGKKKLLNSISNTYQISHNPSYSFYFNSPCSSVHNRDIAIIAKAASHWKVKFKCQFCLHLVKVLQTADIFEMREFDQLVRWEGK